MNAKKSEMYLFFDTETTVLPILNSVPAEVFAGNWPRLVQLSWILTDYVVCHNAWYDTNLVMGEMISYAGNYYFLVLCVDVLGTMCGGNSNWGE